MRNFRCTGPAARDWRPTRQARCPHGCGRPTANKSCGPMRPACGCSARPMPQRLPDKTFGPADRHRRQIARLASRLPASGAIRLERLQGFGAAPGGLATCGCLRFDFPDGSHGVLIAAGNIALIAPLPARPRLRRPQRDAVEAAAPEPAAPPSAPIGGSQRHTLGSRGRSAGAIGRSARRVCVVRRL